MKQKFTPASIEQLKEYLWAKPEPTDIEKKLLIKADKYIKEIRNISALFIAVMFIAQKVVNDGEVWYLEEFETIC